MTMGALDIFLDAFSLVIPLAGISVMTRGLLIHPLMLTGVIGVWRSQGWLGVIITGVIYKTNAMLNLST